MRSAKGMLRDKKGVALYMTAFIIILALVAVATGTAAFQNYANFTIKYLEDARQRHLRECGVERGLWYVINGYGPLAGAPYNQNLEVGDEMVAVTISLDGATGIYTITSTYEGKTTTAKYQAQKIIEWK